jgi:hypothetical protein
LWHAGETLSKIEKNVWEYKFYSHLEVHNIRTRTWGLFENAYY